MTSQILEEGKVSVRTRTGIPFPLIFTGPIPMLRDLGEVAERFMDSSLRGAHRDYTESATIGKQ